MHVKSFILSDSSWNGQTSQLIVSGSDKTATLRALSPVTLYFIRIVSENALGHSSPSEVINVTTSEEGRYKKLSILSRQR